MCLLDSFLYIHIFYCLEGSEWGVPYVGVVHQCWWLGCHNSHNHSNNSSTNLSVCFTSSQLTLLTSIVLATKLGLSSEGVVTLCTRVGDRQGDTTPARRVLAIRKFVQIKYKAVQTLCKLTLIWYIQQHNIR